MLFTMDQGQRLVLQKNHMDIVEDLHVNEDFLGRCYQEQLFDRHDIETIKAERLNRHQAHKVLELLPRRGPSAFDTFVCILQHQYPWLAKQLQDTHDREKEKEEITRDDIQGKQLSVPKSDSEIASPRVTTTQKSQDDEVNFTTDQLVKERVEQFYHKSFGLNRKMSTTDKRAIEKFLHDQIILERLRQQRSMQEEVIDAHGRPDPHHTPPVIKQWLLDVHQKLREDQNHNVDDDAHNLKSISFEIVENQIGTLLSRVHKLEDHVMNVCELFPEKARKKSPRALVENLISKYHQMEADLEQQKKEVDQMTQEYYDLIMDKKKVVHESQKKDVQLEVKNNQLCTLQEEIRLLKIEVDRLQRINQQHAEKERTLSHLQIMVDELRESCDQIKDENTNLKQKLENGKTSPRLSTRRSISFNKGTKMRSQGSKKRTNNHLSFR